MSLAAKVPISAGEVAVTLPVRVTGLAFSVALTRLSVAMESMPMAVSGTAKFQAVLPEIPA